jgi:hypothetical protein
MNGYGHFLAGHLWFSAYWTCLAIALLTTAVLYWPRGTGLALKARTRIARQRFRAPARWTLALSLTAFAALGAFIFYNTNVINRYVPGDLAKQQKADYEKHYRQYKDLAQPRITDISAASTCAAITRWSTRPTPPSSTCMCCCRPRCSSSPLSLPRTT